VTERARRFDRAWRLICEDGSLTRTRARISINDLRSLINRVLDAVYDQDAADLEDTVSAVIMAIGDTEGEPIALRAATILAAIRDKI
jgi:hypothetical protein